MNTNCETVEGFTQDLIMEIIKIDYWLGRSGRAKYIDDLVKSTNSENPERVKEILNAIVDEVLEKAPHENTKYDGVMPKYVEESNEVENFVKKLNLPEGSKNNREFTNWRK